MTLKTPDLEITPISKNPCPVVQKPLIPGAKTPDPQISQTVIEPSIEPSCINSYELENKNKQSLFRNLIDEKLTYPHSEMEDCYVYVDFGGDDLERYSVKSVSPKRIRVVMGDRTVKQVDPAKTKVYYQNGGPNLGRVVIGDPPDKTPSIPLNDEGEAIYEKLIKFLPNEPSLMTDGEKARFFKEVREFAQRMQNSPKVKLDDLDHYISWFEANKRGYATIKLSYILSTWNEAMDWQGAGVENGRSGQANHTQGQRNSDATQSGSRAGAGGNRPKTDADRYAEENRDSMQAFLNSISGGPRRINPPMGVS